MFLHDAVGFRHAEEVRFTDDRRRGRMWDGFIGERNLRLKRDAASIDAFKAAIRDRLSLTSIIESPSGSVLARRGLWPEGPRPAATGKEIASCAALTMS